MWAENLRVIPALREAGLKPRHCPCWSVADSGERQHPSRCPSGYLREEAS